MILIDALYICQSGGKNLLDLLINQFEKESLLDDVTILIDNRIKEFYINRKFHNIKFEFLKGSEYARYKYYSKNKKTLSKVFCFANIPPPIRLDCKVITYFQNVLLLDKSLQKYFPLKNNLLFALKGYIIKQRRNKTDIWLVQTDHVKELILKWINPPIDHVKIIPFYKDETLYNAVEFDQKENAFFFPAVGASHKNHIRLLQAWRNLTRTGKIKHNLHLTIDRNATNKLYLKISKLQAEGVPIINHGYLSKTEIEKLYSECKFVIHPSLGESFGLVLIEALKNNCILIAPDLPYVNAIIKPNYFFNASNVDSIEKSIIKAISEENCFSSEIFVKSELESLIKYILN